MDLDHSLQEDEILDEWDVYINTELTPFLHLAPLPSSSLAGRFNSPSASPLQARFKPQARRLELHLPFTDLSSENLAEDRLRDLQINEKGQKIVGAGWPWRRVQYLLGTFTTGTCACTMYIFLIIILILRWWNAHDSSRIGDSFECLFESLGWTWCPFKGLFLFFPLKFFFRNRFTSFSRRFAFYQSIYHYYHCRAE